MPDTATIVIAHDLPADAPEWIRLMPIGEVGYPGRDFRLDDPAVVVSESLKTMATMVIDFDHQTDLVAKTGAAAPAAGWIVALDPRADGYIWARVEWTDAGRQALASRSYRFLSPVFDVAGGKVRRIIRAGLTNSPAFGERLQIAASQGDQDVTDIARIAAALGLAEDAPADAIRARADAATKEAADVRRALGLPPEAGLDVVLAAVAKRPAAEDYARVATRLQAIEDERQTERVEATVAEAMRTGKLTPAQREWATTYARADLDGFRAFAAAQPVVVAPGELLSGKPRRDDDTVDDVETTICAALGLSKDAYVKARAEEARQ